MSVLDTFIHDPLAEWEDEKRKRVSLILQHHRRSWLLNQYLSAFRIDKIGGMVIMQLIRPIPSLPKLSQDRL